MAINFDAATANLLKQLIKDPKQGVKIEAGEGVRSKWRDDKEVSQDGTLYWGTKNGERIFELFMPFDSSTWGKPLDAKLSKEGQKRVWLMINGKLLQLDYDSFHTIYMDVLQRIDQDERKQEPQSETAQFLQRFITHEL